MGKINRIKRITICQPALLLLIVCYTVYTERSECAVRSSFRTTIIKVESVISNSINFYNTDILFNHKER